MTQLLSKPEHAPEVSPARATPAASVSAPLEEPTRTRFTVAQFQRMWDEGILERERGKRFELIEGEILEMPGNPPHRHAVTKLTGMLARALPEVEVSAQSFVNLRFSDTRPEPDVLVIPLEKYDEETYRPEDAALVIEVSDSTLRYDQRTKLELYARAGFQEYWILNLPARTLEQHRAPFEGGYKQKTTLEPGEVASCLAYPALALEWWWALPTVRTDAADAASSIENELPSPSSTQDDTPEGEEN